MLRPGKASRDFHSRASRVWICILELRGTKREDYWIWRQALPACLCNCLATQISQVEVTPDSPNVQSVRKLLTLFLSEGCASSSGQESTRMVWLWFDLFCTLKPSSGFACCWIGGSHDYQQNIFGFAVDINCRSRTQQMAWIWRCGELNLSNIKWPAVLGKMHFTAAPWRLVEN